MDVRAQSRRLGAWDLDFVQLYAGSSWKVLRLGVHTSTFVAPAYYLGTLLVKIMLRLDN